MATLDRACIAAQLHRMARSAVFAHAGRMYPLLEYLVEAGLTGGSTQLAQYSIAVDVFGREAAFDPASDAIVRVEIGRLRSKLREYYATEGSADPLLIELPKGSYAPSIRSRVRSAAGRPAGSFEQDIRCCRTRDGIRLAYSTAGSGYPLVVPPDWPSDLEADFTSSMLRHYWLELARRFRLIRYDTRGFGLSDRDVPDFPFDALVMDLETVVESLRLERFALLGSSAGAFVAVAYAARHPEQVSHLILLGGIDRAAVLTASSGAHAERHCRVLDGFDWSVEAGSITAATLVCHGAEELGVPLEEGRCATSRVPGESFVPLPTGDRVRLSDEAAWRAFVREIERFVRP